MSLQDHVADPKFRSYITNIQAKTGQSPDDFVRFARKRGLLAPGVKSGQIVKWLEREFGLGRGHAMAVVVVLRAAAPRKYSFQLGLVWRTLFAREVERWRLVA